MQGNLWNILEGYVTDAARNPKSTMPRSQAEAFRTLYRGLADAAAGQFWRAVGDFWLGSGLLEVYGGFWGLSGFARFSRIFAIELCGKSCFRQSKRLKHSLPTAATATLKAQVPTLTQRLFLIQGGRGACLSCEFTPARKKR